MDSSPFLLLFLLSFSLIAPLSATACSMGGCQIMNPCSDAEKCAPGLYCGTCPASGKTQPSCTRGQTTRPTDFVRDLPFNKYTWLVTHNSFSILNAPSTGVQRVTFYNQEDTVTNQLLNGVRGLMLDMYDFDGDIWLCHSFQGQCFNFTAFEPAINTLKEVEAFLTGNPTEIVTIFIEDYVHTPKGLRNLFTDAGLIKYLFPVMEMPTNGKDWPTFKEMVEKNYRLLIFTSIASKEADEGIAYQWRYVLENEFSRFKICCAYSEFKFKEITQPKESELTNTWNIKMLYDGECPLCMREVNMLRERNQAYGTIKFVDISSENYLPDENQGLDYKTVMGKIHAIESNGTVYTNVEAFRRLYEEVGLGWIYTITKYEPITTITNLIYKIWATYRLQLTGRPPLEKILASKINVTNVKCNNDKACKM